MKTFIQKLLAATLLVMPFACGGQIEAADEGQDLKAPLSFEPFTSFAAARTRADKYGANCAAVGLAGTLASDKQGYGWSWSFQCDNRMYVSVSAGPSSVRVTRHQVRAYFMGMGTFDPASVNVNATDLVSLLKKQGYALPDSVSLSAPLTQKMEPRWTASVAKKTLVVDASTGDVNG